MRKNSLPKKAFLLVTCYLLLATLVWGCAKREIKNIDSRGTNIICFGDSLTFGYGASRGEDYPLALAKMVDLPVINAGIDGDTSTEALRRLRSDVLKRDPLLVIIEFGGNDFLRRISQEVTLKNVKEMVDKIQAKGAMVAIVDVSVGVFLKEHRRAFYDLARQKQVIFIPNILRGIITNPHLKSDFLHPNADGYKVLAQRIHRSILPYLNRNTILKKFGE